MVARRFGPPTFGVLIFEKLVAEERVVVFPGFATQVDHGLGDIVVVVEIGVFLEVKGVVLLHVAASFADGFMAISFVLLDTQGACAGETKVAIGRSAWTCFAVSESAVILLGIGDRLQSCVGAAAEVFEFQSGVLGGLESLEVPGVDRSIPSRALLVLVIPSADFVLVVDAPLPGALCDFC